MSHLPPPAAGATPYPGPPPVAYDPVAVAVGNASLLGLGYLMARRRGFAVLNWIGTATFVVLLVSVRELWCELALIGWWLLVVVHGWLLARTKPYRKAQPRKRIIALAVAMPILLVAGLLRIDTARIDDKVIDARDAGDCGQVKRTADRLGFWHRLTDGPKTVRSEGDVAACERIDEARSDLADGARGNLLLLDSGFKTLSEVLNRPGQDRTVGRAVDEFLTKLSKSTPCAVVQVTGWLRSRTPTHTTLDRAAAAVPKFEPNALLSCGDAQAMAQQWPSARSTYEQLVGRYPKAKQAARARGGVQRATLAIELANVRDLVTSATYCDSPAQYSGAPPYHRGVNPTLFLGDNEYTSRLPSQWKTSDPYRATLILCAGEANYGTAVRTCPYTPELNPSAVPTDVTFHQIAIPVKVYELRTGRQVYGATVEIAGSSCPRRLNYTTSVPYLNDYVPSTQYVAPTNATIKAAFQALVIRR
ncbi:hypothetical protein AB0E69_09395 [Kribbella sp. NPDC026611]|uniref:tetratricopeptide repeat protein n=1 Tax=Kribbella sp. NPDC026611 TaxID=3154911 RepID=UPI0033F99A9A